VALTAHGIEAHLPAGLEGRIYVRPSSNGAVSRPVAQFATFPIPEGIGDFGGNTNIRLGPDDMFAVLFEYGPESVGTALFSLVGVPRPLDPTDFVPHVMAPGLGGSLGIQRFFTESGRPFTLYARLGSIPQRNSLVKRLNRLLSTVDIHPNASSAT
jgi:hypothetical protein